MKQHKVVGARDCQSKRENGKKKKKRKKEEELDVVYITATKSVIIWVTEFITWKWINVTNMLSIVETLFDFSSCFENLCN